VAAVPAAGAQLQIDVSDGVPLLVLQLTTPKDAGAGSTSVVFTNDVLTSDGQAAPAPVPLWVNPATTTTTTAAASTSSSTSTTGGGTTTTTSAGTTTTTRPVVCGIPVGTPSSDADAVWPLDDRSTTAVDISGNGNDATIANASAYDQTPGPLSQCATDGGLVFDGSSTSVTAPDAVAVNDGDATVVAFVNAAAGPGGDATIIANDDPTTSNNGLALEIAANSDGALTGLRFQVGTSSGLAQAAVQPPTPLAAGQWHLLVGTYDASTGAVTLYADGQSVGTSTAPPGSTIDAGSEPVTLGVDPVSSSNWFDGQLADLAVLSETLTAQQVAAIWSAAQGS